LHALPALTRGLLFEHQPQVIFHGLLNLCRGVRLRLGHDTHQEKGDEPPCGRRFSASAWPLLAKRKKTLAALCSVLFFCYENQLITSICRFGTLSAKSNSKAVGWVRPAQAAKGIGK
jgi:hypothetical protein